MKQTVFAMIAVAALLWVVPPVQAQDEAPVVLEPSSDWVLDYADDSCALRRSFGEPGATTWLEMRQFGPGMRVRITIGTQQFDRRRGRYPVTSLLPGQQRLTYRLAAFGEYGEDFESVAFYEWMLHSGVTATYSPNGSGEQFPMPEASEINGILLESVFERNIQLQTGDLAGPITALAECTDDLMSHLGAANPTSLSQLPVPLNIADWSEPIAERYPRRMLQRQIQGRVMLRVLVDVAGQPVDCMVQEPVVDPDYQERVCAIVLEDGEYSPALNRQGEAVQAIHNLSINYVIGSR